MVLVEPSKSVRQPRVKPKREDSFGLNLKGYGSPWTFWSFGIVGTLAITCTDAVMSHLPLKPHRNKNTHKKGGGVCQTYLLYRK